MVQRSRGSLSGRTRHLTNKRKLTVSDMVRTYEIGNKVLIMVKPRRDGMPAPRYHGRHGTILSKQGGAYLVEVQDGRAKKKLVVSPIHLREVA